MNLIFTVGFWPGLGVFRVVPLLAMVDLRIDLPRPVETMAGRKAVGRKERLTGIRLRVTDTNSNTLQPPATPASPGSIEIDAPTPLHSGGTCNRSLSMISTPKPENIANARKTLQKPDLLTEYSRIELSPFAPFASSDARLNLQHSINKDPWTWILA